MVLHYAQDCVIQAPGLPSKRIQIWRPRSCRMAAYLFVVSIVVVIHGHGVAFAISFGRKVDRNKSNVQPLPIRRDAVISPILHSSKS